jgi:formylglycine-generating enzyme required for sulfatase activity
MHGTRADEKSIIGLDEPSLIYNYQFSQSRTEHRISHDNSYRNKNYFNKSFKSSELVHLNYKGIDFSMITCPSDKSIFIDTWGTQYTKEPFLLGETEVSQDLFESVMGFNHSNLKLKKANNPIINVSWFDCLDFCNRLSDYFGLDCCYLLNNKEYSNSEYPLSIEKANAAFIIGANGFRLPKEWEWQIAAMAGTRNKYAGANDDESLKEVAWFDDNSGYKLHPVAQKMPNEWGFYDMSGNIYEWCENANRPSENNNLYAERIFRGGSWGSSTKYMCSDHRTHDYPQIRRPILGFRIARTI